MSRLFYILKKTSLIFAYNATAITMRVMGCIDAKKISPDCPSGNFQENMHSLRKVYFCVEKLTFSIHSKLSSYKYLWRNTIDLRGRRVIMPSGLGLFCFLVSILEILSAVRCLPSCRQQSSCAGWPWLRIYRLQTRAVRDPFSRLHLSPTGSSPFLDSSKAPLLISWS